MRDPVRRALIGIGWCGKRMRAALQAAPDEIRVVRAVEPIVNSVAGPCAERGVMLSADYFDALADPNVEAVDLATPHGLHGDQSAEAAAGKHVFCEKPLALTKAGAETAVALRQGAGFVLDMGHERRWDPPIADMLARADRGELGRIHQIEANFSQDKSMASDRSFWRLQARNAAAGGMTATRIYPADLSVRLLGPAESGLRACGVGYTSR